MADVFGAFHRHLACDALHAIGLVNTRSGSTASGASASAGKTAMRTMSKSATTTDEGESLLRVPTPGDILRHELLEPLGVSQNALARTIGVPPGRINEIVLGKRAVTAETDLRLCRYWGLSEGFFLRLQNTHDRLVAKRRLGDALEQITPRAAAEAA